MSSGATHDETWLSRCSRTDEPKVRLLCLPYAGGATSIFRDWSSELPRTVEVCPLKLPGRESRFGDPVFSSVGPLIEAMAPTLVDHFDRPYALYGHSMGALIALSLAFELERRYQRQPACLLVGARRAPHLPDPDAPLHTMGDEQLIDELRRRHGDPSGALEHPELVELMLPTIRADCAMCETYRQPDGKLSCPITVIGGTGDKIVGRDDLEGWRDYTTGRFTCRMIEGDHFFLNTARSTLLDAIAADLGQAVGGLT